MANWLDAFNKEFWKRKQPVKGEPAAKESTVEKVRYAPGAVTQALTNPSQRRNKR